MEKIHLTQGKFPEYMDFVDRFDKYLGGEAHFVATDHELIQSLRALGYGAELTWTIPIEFWSDLTYMYSKGDDRAIGLVSRILGTMGVYWGDADNA